MPLEIFAFRIVCALVGGILIGLERLARRRNAGLAVNTLVAVGACVNNDNLRVLSQVVTGIGFLGAGVIMKDGFTIHGLNSAATIWCSAAVGCLCGYGMWRQAAIAVAVVVAVNWILRNVEQRIEDRRDRRDKEKDPPAE